MLNVRGGAPAPERLHALDAVRGGALLLGIVFHASYSFVPVPTKIWIVEDNHRSLALALLVFTTHVFRMTTFFLIAGFFAHMSFHRRGVTAFIGDRLKRIALPLAVGWPIVFGALLAVATWAANEGLSTPPPPFPTFPHFPLAHLWFLYVLLEFYAAILVLRGGVALMDRSGGIRAGVDRLVRLLLMRGPLGAIIMAAPVGAAFAANHLWLMWFCIPAPTESFVTSRTALIGYGSAFCFGWLLHRQVELLRMLERDWALNLILAIGLITVSLALVGVTPRLTPVEDDAIRLAGAACYAVATWTATFAVIGLALRFLSGLSPARRYVADASYWLYLIHWPIVAALQVAVSRLDWPWPAKLAAILAIAFPLMFASYELVVRHSFIGLVLNGRRVPRSAAMRPEGSIPAFTLESLPTARSPGVPLNRSYLENDRRVGAPLGSQ
jgi:glucan biosynthesis protein C